MGAFTKELSTPSEVLCHEALPVLHFETQHLDAAHRFEAWRNEVAPVFDIEADKQYMRSGILVQQSAANLGEALIGSTRAQSHTFSRSPGRVARDGLDHLMIQVFQRGGGAMREREVEPGDLLIIDTGQPHFMHNDDFANVTMMLPRGTDPRLSGILERLHGRTLSSRDPRARLLGGHLTAIWDAIADITPDHAPAISQGAIGLMVHALSGEADRLRETRPEVAAAMKHAVMEYLEAHLHRPVSVEELTQRFNISRSLLYRMFEPQGGVLSHIRERRLRSAYRKLSEPGSVGQTIGEIAFSCGFLSEAHFSRAFRQRFGIRPRDARAASLSVAPEAKKAPVGPGEGSPLASWLSSLSMLERR